MLDAFDHLSVGLEEIVERHAPDPDPGRLPLARAKFNFNASLESPATEFAGLARRITTPARRAEYFELFLNVEEDSEGLLLACQYETALFDGATVQAWLGLYAAALRRLVAQPETVLAELFAPTPEDDRLLRSFNDRAAAFDAAERIETRVARQAAATPQAVAVTSRGPRAELPGAGPTGQRCVAARLVAAGWRQATWWALCCARSEWMLVGLLGVWKAGAGYVPLGPCLPGRPAGLHGRRQRPARGADRQGQRHHLARAAARRPCCWKRARRRRCPRWCRAPMPRCRPT